MDDNQKDDNNVMPKRNSMKMQDLFKEFDVMRIKSSNSIKSNKQRNENETNEGELKNDDKEALFSLKDSIYKSIYAPSNSESISEDKKEEEKPKVNLQRKNNLLSYKNNNNIFNNELIYIEPIALFIDDITKKYSEIIIQNYECKFIFDEEVQHEFINLVHFNPKYFEFPVFYIYKGTYDEASKITTLTLKDYRSFKIMSSNNNIYKKLLEPPNNKVDFYKYAQFYKKYQEKNNIKYEIDGWNIYDPICEYLRQGIEFSDNQFCFSYLNKKYELCETYPSVLVIPKKFDNEGLFQIAKSRMKNRFPLLSYHYHQNSKDNNNKKSSYLFRSAQIKKGGIIFKSKNLEIDYMNKIMDMENTKKGFIIFDCRPVLNAKANALKGAGVEDYSQYNNCQNLLFGCIENIHCVRNSLKTAMRKAYYGKESAVKGKVSFDTKNNNLTSFLSKFESSKWLNYLSDLLLGSILVAKNMISDINVLVHCSDGWDRTSQVCSLVQIILDPYFRTIEGFAVLVEKEWVSFGHQFATRNGCDINKEKQKEKSPIFIQFLHAVYQMTIQYPTAFEFNSNFLLFLCEEIYSNKYGTFLFNCEKDKFNNNIYTSMISIWSDVFLHKNKYINDLYKQINGTLNIKGEVKYLSIWNDYFFKYDKIGMAWDDGAILDKETYVGNIVEERTKSILDLLKIIKNCGQEELMKDNKLYKLYKNELDKYY